MGPNTTELTGLIKNEVDSLDYPRYHKDGECFHSFAINHVLVVDHCTEWRNLFFFYISVAEEEKKNRIPT